MRALIFLGLSLAMGCETPNYGHYNPYDTADRGGPGQPGDPNSPGTDPADDTSDPEHNGGSGLMPVAQSGSRLKRRVRVGADGSEEFVGWWDDDLGTECLYTTAANGTMRCLPWGTDVALLSDSGQFANSDCTQRLYSGFLRNTSCSTPSAPRWFRVPGPCDTAVREQMNLHSGPVYAEHIGQCIPGTRNQSLEYWTGGTVVPPATFVSAQVQIR